MSKKNKILKQQTQQQLSVSKQMSFSGPIPPPQFLEKYNEIFPGAAEIIIKMAKEQAEHRQALEKTVIHSDIRNSLLGLVFGLIIGLSGLAAGTFLIISGYQTTGAIIGGGTLSGLVGTFIYGSRGRKKEREAKNK